MVYLTFPSTLPANIQPFYSTSPFLQAVNSTRYHFFIHMFLLTASFSFSGRVVPCLKSATLWKSLVCYTFSITYFMTFDINTTHSTWLERVVLIAILEPKSSLLPIISPPNSLNLREQVNVEIPRKCLYFSKSVKGNLWLFYGFGRSPIGKRSKAFSKMRSVHRGTGNRFHSHKHCCKFFRLESMMG